MQYMIAFNEPADEFAKRHDPKTSGPHWGAWTAYIDAMAKAGIIISGNGLLGPETASTVRVRDGKRAVHDGPFADTKEQLAGYFIIEVPNLDTALDWAAQAPAALNGSVEVRPVMPPPNA
jgi:hypothetical protein